MSMAAKIGQDGYLYHCVPAISLPVTHEVQISSSSPHGESNGVGVATEQNLSEMINILTPILNVDEKPAEHHAHNLHHHPHHHLFNPGAMIKSEAYIIHENVHTAIKLEHPLEDDLFQKLNGGVGNGEVGCSSSGGGSAGSGSPETEMKRTERLQKDIFRKKMARLRESDDQRVERLKKDRIRKKRARQNESLEQRQRRLEKDRVRIQKRRAVETDDERQRRLEKNRISKRKARLKENSLMKDLHM